MKRSTVVVPWADGLQFRPAARIIRAAQSCHSSVVLRCGERIADVRSILSLVMLCATMGMAISIEVSGEDEQVAIEAVERIFAMGEGDLE